MPADDAILAVVDAHLAAFNARDPDAVTLGFCPDGAFSAGSDLVEGQRAIHALFADSFALPAQATLHRRSAIVQGDTAACELLERIVVAGTVVEVPVAAFYEVRDGLLARVRVYRDPA